MMELSFSKAIGRVPVTIIMVSGSIDASSYRSLIEHAQRLIRDGAKDLLIDLTNTNYISSAGVLALHSIIKMMRSETLDSNEDGWEALRDMDRDRGSGKQAHIKLLNPQPRVDDILDTVGLKEFFEIYTDIDRAVNSY